MRKCIELIRRKLFHTLRMCRLSKGFETWKLFTKADILQRNLDAERISAWIQLNNDRRDAMDEHREKCLLVVLKRKNLIELREAWKRWQELVYIHVSRKRAARKVFVFCLSSRRNFVRDAFWNWKAWCQRDEIERLRSVLTKALEMSERQVAFANGIVI